MVEHLARSEVDQTDSKKVLTTVGWMVIGLVESRGLEMAVKKG